MTIALVDAHCHLESDEFQDSLPAIIREARQAGLVRLITCSITPQQWQLSLSIADRFPEVRPALGVHPWYAHADDIDDLDDLASIARGRAVAIGEIGLDRKNPRTDYALQTAVFEKQMRIARELNLPVILHCRGAFDDLARFVRRDSFQKDRGIIHAFSGSVEIAEEMIKLGFSFSLGGTLTYPDSRKRERVLYRIFPDHMLLETDSPDIPPAYLRDRPNVPANMVYNLRAAARILGVSEEKIAEATTANARRIFDLGI